MTDANRTRPTTLEEALAALDAAEAKLNARVVDDSGITRLTENVKRTEERFRMIIERSILLLKTAEAHAPDRRSPALAKRR